MLGCGGAAQSKRASDGARDVEATEAGDHTPILGGHLSMSMPSGAKLSPRRTSIMAAEEASEDETRIILEEGSDSARFVMMITELYRTTTGDVLRDAKASASKGDRVGALPMEGGLRAATLEPSGIGRGEGPIFVLGVLCAHVDHTVQQIEFFILPEMAGDIADYRTRARDIARTLRPGTRRIDAPGGEARFDRFSMTLPPGFLLSTQRGPDFEVHRIRKLTRIGDTSGLLGIYVGGHPSLQHAQSSDGGAAPPTKEEAGNLLGKEATWIAWNTPEGARVRETIVTLEDHLAVHTFAISGDEAIERELMTIAASLRQASR